MSKNMSSLYPIKAEIAIERASRIVMEWEEELDEISKIFEISQEEFDEKSWFYRFWFVRPSIVDRYGFPNGDGGYKIWRLKNKIKQAKTIITNAEACGEKIIYLSESDMKIIAETN